MLTSEEILRLNKNGESCFLSLKPFMRSFFFKFQESRVLKTKNSDYNTLHTETPLLHPSSYNLT